MKNRVRWILLAGFAFPPLASAGWIDRSGDSLADTAFRKSDAGFSAWLVFVPDDRKFYEAWNVPSESVEIQEIESVNINSPISAFVVFSGCKPDASGNCNVLMRYRVLAPDGSVYSDSPSMEVWKDKPAPQTRTLELSVEYLKVVVEPDEQMGRYSVQAQVKDVNSGRVLQLERVFTAVDSKSVRPPAK